MDVSEPTAGSLILAIRGLLPALNEQEQKVGQYVLDRPREVIHLAMNDLAERCGVSETTVFRFCRKVRTNGYQDFKIRLALELAAGQALTYASAQPGDSATEAAAKVIAADIKALQDTLSVLDVDAMDRAADVLLAARRVDLYGSGGGAMAALELQYKLMRLGVRAVPHTDPESQVISATLLTEDDAAVAISHSGEAQELLHALRIARDAGARTIAITNHPASPLAGIAGINLHTSAQEALAHGYPLGARVAQIGLIDILYTVMALKRQGEAEENQRRIAVALNKRHG